MANKVQYVKLWEPNQINNAANEVIYTATKGAATGPSSSIGVVKNISAVISNTTALAATVEVWVIPSGGSAGDTKKLINGETVPANGRLSFTVSDMSVGDSIEAKAGTATALTIHCTSGIVIN